MWMWYSETALFELNFTLDVEFIDFKGRWYIDHVGL